MLQEVHGAVLPVRRPKRGRRRPLPRRARRAVGPHRQPGPLRDRAVLHSRHHGDYRDLLSLVLLIRRAGIQFSVGKLIYLFIYFKGRKCVRGFSRIELFRDNFGDLRCTSSRSRLTSSAAQLARCVYGGYFFNWRKVTVILI